MESFFKIAAYLTFPYLITLVITLNKRILITSRNGSRTKNFEFGPSVLLANAMSLLPKIDEVRCVVHEENPDLVCITETWLHASTINEHLFIPGYNVMFKNRASQLRGCVYIYKELDSL